MKKMALVFAAIFGFIFCAQCQFSDTLSAKVLWVKNVYLIGVMPDHKSAGKIIVASELTDSLDKKGEQIKVGKTYTWAIKEPIVFAWGSMDTWVEYGGVRVWTSKKPLKKQPRLCLNCNGKYISSLY
jgi:hypothetical protein